MGLKQHPQSDKKLKIVPRGLFKKKKKKIDERKELKG